MIETWSAAKGESYLYTDSPTIAEFVKDDFPRCATYVAGGRIRAWHFLLPNHVLRMMLPHLEAEETQRQIVS